MIEIKNKHMILFPEDRLIGAQGDVDSAQRKFILDRDQDGFDLSKMIAWIKINPLGGGEEAYDQLLKKEIKGDKIILSWRLSGANLKSVGELSAQIIFADPDYFSEADLANLSDTDLIVPATVSGVSAPVWQSYCETFVVAESIDDTIAYKEVTKNILVAAIAEASNAANDAASASEQAQIAAETARKMTSDVQQKIDDAEVLLGKLESCEDNTLEHLKEAEESAALAMQKAQEADNSSLLAQEYAEQAAASSSDAAAYAERAQLCYDEASLSEYSAGNNAYMALVCRDEAKDSADRASVYAEVAETALKSIKKARDYRLIYKKTLTEEDTDCYSFEITQDADGNSLRLSEFVVFLYIPAMPETGSSYIVLNIQADGYESNGAIGYSTLAQFAGIAKTKDYYSRLECAQLGRWTVKASRGTSWNQNVESLNVYGNVCSPTRYPDGKSATAIRLIQSADVGVAFPAETMVEVWGIDSIIIEEGESAE